MDDASRKNRLRLSERLRKLPQVGQRQSSERLLTLVGRRGS
ncbi:hypothetical protein P4237_07830 [Pseudomonas aeruginosa]|nr:hypothetical protein [Pseudomonas aeruginosa]